MKFFVTGLLLSTLLLAQGCKSSVESKEAQTTTSPHHNHSMGSMEHDDHSGMETPEMAKKIQAKLTVANTINSKAPVPLVIDIQDKNGKVINQFHQFQEKLMHLIVVSDNLQSFNHIHPQYKGNGHFEVAANFPQPGSYTLFSDYKPAGQKEQVSVLKAQAPGKNLNSTKIDLNRNKTIADTKINFSTSQTTVKADEEVHLIFKLQNPASDRPIADLQPYLGEKGHLVILRQSSPLKATDYIHAHAMKSTPPGEVHFMTSFPQPGNYKLWGQFNRNGKIVTADFWVNVV